MSQAETDNNWLSDNEIDIENDDPFQTEESDSSQDAVCRQKGQLRRAGSPPQFLHFSQWNPERSYKETALLRYNVEWKVFVKNRERGGQSELDVVLSPKDLWKHVLQPKVKETIAKKPWKEETTKLVLAVNDCKTDNITKRVPKTDVDWSFVTKKLQEWGKLLGVEKRISVRVTFYYEEHAAEISATGKGATANQAAELAAIIDEEVAVLGRPAAIRKAYALMRCTGPPCKYGKHCWQYKGKHYRLLIHHVKMLADFMQQGNAVDGHDDVPENFRRALLDEEQEREERERREQREHKKRKRRDSHDSVSSCRLQAGLGRVRATIPNRVFPASPLINLDLKVEDAISAYSVWLRSTVKSEEQKQYYRLAEELIISKGYTLDMIASNQERMCVFFEEHDIPEGFAWNYVCQVLWFKESHDSARG